MKFKHFCLSCLSLASVLLTRPSRHRMRTVLLLLLLGAVGSAQADIAVLIHGLDSNGFKWRKAGIVQQLVNSGWVDAGHLGPRGPLLYAPPTTGSAEINRLFTVDIPNDAPVEVQAYYLAPMLESLHMAYPNEPITLVGHSAGGLIARFVMINRPDLNINRLVTIATPHLGTKLATMGYMIKSTPMGMMAEMFDMDPLPGDSDLLDELRPPKRGNFIGWLGYQSHPPAAYISIVRRGGDDYVSAFSQNMNNVPALRGRSQVIYTPGGHALNPFDGGILARILIPSK